MKKQKLTASLIYHLTQEEGLIDSEVAEATGSSVHYVIELRKKYNIPPCSAMNRKDKKVKCPNCGSIYYIKRRERPGICCPDCVDILNRGL